MGVLRQKAKTKPKLPRVGPVSPNSVPVSFPKGRTIIAGKVDHSGSKRGRGQRKAGKLIDVGLPKSKYKSHCDTSLSPSKVKSPKRTGEYPSDLPVKQRIKRYKHAH